MQVLPLSTLFIKKPDSLTLKGDLFLWNEMKLKVDSVQKPTTEENFKDLIYDLFFKLTGEKLVPNKKIRVERYAVEDDANGYVGTDFWIDGAVATLKERFRKMQD